MLHAQLCSVSFPDESPPHIAQHALPTAGPRAGVAQYVSPLHFFIGLKICFCMGREHIGEAPPGPAAASCGHRFFPARTPQRRAPLRSAPLPSSGRRVSPPPQQQGRKSRPRGHRRPRKAAARAGGGRRAGRRGVPRMHGLTARPQFLPVPSARRGSPCATCRWWRRPS